jgi:hypothetical protein
MRVMTRQDHAEPRCSGLAVNLAGIEETAL